MFMLRRIHGRLGGEKKRYVQCDSDCIRQNKAKSKKQTENLDWQEIHQNCQQ